MALAYSSFAQKMPIGSLFIDGASQREELAKLFEERFIDEAKASGYNVTGSQSDAAYSFSYTITENTGMDAESNEPIIRIIIINNSDGEEILDFEYYFTDINEMYNYTQFLFQRAAISIPLPRRNDLIDVGWQNKLLYIRASFDYPIKFFALQPDGLIGGIGVYEDKSDPPRISPEDNKVLAMPGATVGLEVQFLSFMSIELNVQFSMGDTRDNNFVNLAAGAELKFPLKFFPNIVIEPYTAFTYPITVSDIFHEFPLFMVGGGLQAGTKGGKNGSFFVDAGFMYSIRKAGMHNPYGGLYPKPSVIYYNYYLLKLGVGYKFGLINRKDDGSTLIKHY